MDENKIIIIDDNNQEHEMTILFTFEDEKTKKKYVAYFDPSDLDGNVYASIYDDENRLYPIEDEKEWKMVEEVLDAYMQEMNEEEGEEGEEGAEEHECCGHHHHHDEEEEHECECEHKKD